MKKVLLVFFILLAAAFINAEDLQFQPLSVSITPGLHIPADEEADYYTMGGGGEIAFGLRPEGFSMLGFGGMLGYSLLPVGFGTSVSVISAGASGGLFFDPLEWLSLSAGVSAGAYYAFMNNTTGPPGLGAFILPSAGADFMISPGFSLGLRGNYRNYLGLYQGIDVSLALCIRFGGKEKTILSPEDVKPRPLSDALEAESLRIIDPVFHDIFPVLFKYYDDNPAGTLILKNNTDGKIKINNISFYIRQYMDAPKTCSAPADIPPGGEMLVEINALFTENVLQITESTKTTAELLLDYSIEDEPRLEKYIETVRLYDRNAVTWDDDRKVAAFVTAKDPSVLSLARNAAGIARDEGRGVVSLNLRSAMVIFNSLRLYGMKYASDPKNPYSGMSENTGMVDFLQFPSQSLEYRAGDCDDLSILTNALFEAAGIETAFITVPGHIYTAFSLNMTPEEAEKTFSKADDLIFHDGLAWIPVEVTLVQNSFLDAWAEGAREWREASAKNSAVIIPTHQAWALYEPVGIPGRGTAQSVPAKDELTGAYMAELGRFVEMEVYPLTSKIEEEMQSRGESARLYNRLGIIYARYGLSEQARDGFEKAAALDGQYMPVLVNLGNLSHISGDLKKALEYYTRASAIKPEAASVLLGLARVNHDLENYGISEEVFNKLRQVSPATAAKFAYLDLRGAEAERAAVAGNLKEEMIWQE